MRWLSLVLLCSLILPVLVEGQTETLDPMQQANSAYREGDYETAIVVYAGLLDAGVRDAVVYFNLGNAYFQTGDLGLAMLNYRRAQHLIPRDTELNENMTRIRARRIDLPAEETDPVNNLSAITAAIMTLNELAWIVLMIWVLWGGVLAVVILRSEWRSRLQVPLVVVSGVLLFGILLLGSRLYVEASRPAAVVIAPIAPVMSGPGDDYLEHFQIFAAAEVRALEMRDGWVRFSLPGGRQGWIAQENIAFVDIDARLESE
jgi:tetratricopeptide (TPR) repeat protein